MNYGSLWKIVCNFESIKINKIQKKSLSQVARTNLFLWTHKPLKKSGERSTNWQQQYYHGTTLFMSKQVSLAKMSSILPKNENRAKKWYTPFLRESLQFASVGCNICSSLFGFSSSCFVSFCQSVALLMTNFCLTIDWLSIDWY